MLSQSTDFERYLCKKGSSTRKLEPKICREEYGQCNICSAKSKLTWDHVPPKACYAITPAIQQTLLQEMSSRAGNPREFKETQNSVKFRTLCSSCNNRLLGRKYDPVLKTFVAAVLKMSQTPLAVPDIISIRTKPLALARAVVGHLLAAKGDFEETEYDKTMRDFFMDETQSSLSGLKMFYWYYPYSRIVVIRDVFMPSVRGMICGSASGFSMLKFFPVAFLVSDVDKYEGLSEIPLGEEAKLGEESTLPINLAAKHSDRWPESVNAGNYYVGGKPIESSIIAYEKR